MKTARYNVVYNRKNKLLSNGTALVQVEVYMSGKNKYFSTNIYLTPDQWDSKHRRVKNHPNAIRLNKQISDFMAQLESVELERYNNGKPFTLDHLADFIGGKLTNSFTKFMEVEITQSTVSQNTKKDHCGTLRAFKLFKPDVLFTEMHYELLAEFERYLYNKNLSVNTINKYFGHIRAYVNLAINKDLMDLNKYPFRKFKAKKAPTTRHYLSLEDLALLEQVQIPDDKQHLRKLLDMFLFSCYTGLRFSDISEVKRSKTTIENGVEWLIIKTQKTRITVKLPISLLFGGKPLEIINTYATADPDTPIFGAYSNSYVNKSLKEIAQLANIKQLVTFHIARHTNATHLLNKKVSVTTVQKLLGHKNIETTLIYAKVINSTIVNELESISF